jgi:hypothetical protein
MGLFDLFKSQGALSQSMADAPSPYMQVYQDGNTSMQLNPAYADYVNNAANPRNMDTGMKLMMLGQALQGKDMSGAITNYQSGIRDRFRQRAMDQRQLRQDDLNRAQTELGMRQTQQNMNITQQKLPGELSAQTLRNEGQNLSNQSTQQNIAQNDVMNPLLAQNQRNQNAGQLLQNQTQALQNAQTQQNLLQGKTNNARWVGNHETGVVMRTNSYTGLDEDVTDQYSPAAIAAFKAAQKPTLTANNKINPGVNRALSEAEIQRDKTFAKELETFRPEQAAGNIGVLSMIADELATEQAGDSTGLSLSSPLVSAARILDREGDMGLRALLDQEGIDKQQIVAGVIQQNLRQTLGAQFTQREGMLLIDRAYNPTLPPQMNAKRLKALAMLAEAALKARQQKVEYYNSNNGSLAGYDPKMDAVLEAMKAQVLQVYAANGGIDDGASAATGTTSTGVGFSVSTPTN